MAVPLNIRAIRPQVLFTIVALLVIVLYLIHRGETDHIDAMITAMVLLARDVRKTGPSKDEG